MKNIHFVINFGENEHPYIVIFTVHWDVEPGDVGIIFSKALAESAATDPLLDAIDQVCAETGGEYEILVADDTLHYNGNTYSRLGGEPATEDMP